MKRLGKIAVCLAGALVLSTGARAGDAALAGNPYTPIVVRNVFGLNPPSTNNPADAQDPPPKITPNGIMSIFGQLQVLFKVAPKAGQPGAKEESYVLNEGQRQDDIEVMQIDEKDSLVTFNNHGTVQEIPLANAPALSTPAPAQPGGPPNRNFPAPGFSPAGGGGLIPTRFGGNGPASARGHGPGGAGSPSSMGGTGGTGGTGGSQAGQTGSQMTPEETAVWIETQRALYQNQGSPFAKLLPPTRLNPPPNNGQ